MDYPTTSFDHASLIRHTSSIDQRQASFNESFKINRHRYTARQLLTIFSYIYGNFFLAACVSLQAPFFPREAELKGVSPSAYGLVFGIYELAIIFVSPIVGRMMSFTTPRIWIQFGQLLTGLMTIVFGYLDNIESGSLFIGLAFLIRILEGVGAASFTTPSYTSTVENFPQDQATILALLETAFGFGLICGPTLGALLYEWGNFSRPFLVLGICLMFGALFSFLLCVGQKSQVIERDLAQASYLRILASPGIILDALCVVTSLSFIGFNAATLEPHLRQFDLSVVTMGWLFVITGTIYALTTPLWSKLCRIANTRLLCLIGCVLCLAGFIIIGPMPWLPFEPSLSLIISALVLIGLGTGIKLVASLVGSFDYAIRELSMPDNKSTFGVCSSIYHTATSVGAFIGPTIGGFLLEYYAYRKSTYCLFVSELLLIAGLTIFLLKKWFHEYRISEALEAERLVSSHKGHMNA